MQNSTNQTQLLEEKICSLEVKRVADFKALKSQLKDTYQELRPSRIFIRILKDIKEEPEFKTTIFESLISFVGGYVSKKLWIGKSHSRIKNIFGYMLQYLTTKLILKRMTK
jgi:hypothetical protein